MRFRGPRAAIVRAAVVAAGVAAFGGCASPGYSASKLQRELTEAGLTAEQAKCVTDGMEEKLNLDQLASYSEPTAQEFAKTREILLRCKVTLPPS